MRRVELARRRAHPPDGQAVGAGEVEVALVVGGHRHHRAGAVVRQHVVGDEHRDPSPLTGLTVRPRGHPVFGRSSLAARLRSWRATWLTYSRTGTSAARAGDHRLELGVLGGEDEEGGAEQGVGPGGEDREVAPQLLAAEGDLGSLGAADPVALHGDHVLGPALEPVEVGEQALGVVGDAEEPLLEVALLDRRAAALAAPVDHLLVGEHRGVLGAPLDRRHRSVGQALLEEPQEDPLGPAVVVGRVGGDLAGPVERDAPLLELAPEGLDRGLGRGPRGLAGLDRVVLRRQPEGVIAHRVDHLEAVAAAEVGDRIADGVGLQVADMGLARRVGQHLEHVGLRGGSVLEPGLPGVGYLPGAILVPDPLPLGLDRARVVVLHAAILGAS